MISIGKIIAEAKTQKAKNKEHSHQKLIPERGLPPKA
jgi:hypothetical protein